jgi:hypothetical protein
MFPLRHRSLVYLPFAVFLIATLIGGMLNTVDLHGRVLDDFTNDGIASASVQHGIRTVVTASDGSFDFPNLPKTSKLQIDKPGYLRTGAPTTQEEIRMSPLSLTVAVKEAGVTPDKPIAKADIRQGDKVLGTTNDGGNTVVSPHPGKDQTVLICAEGHESKTVPVHGVTLIVELAAGGSGCPPLPSPSPTASPSGSPAGSPSAPVPSASPSPSPSATP